ncbi:hypothetical protein OIE66_24430 [Nonomuraea sp. NBC_01738]|uniref:SHOCT-like domain-containing protein n=1 Tax=Nonomuraea sp. NBC_01738 TaxID=2976003 RepID=UPI002E0D522C|nr:hypothetical protein OIE66_24430 [Nonomuraea sp. NBC_01738]
MNEQRRDILGLLAEGKITVDEAERLMVALEPVRGSAPKGRPKYLRVIVAGFDEAGGGGRVNVRVPLQLLRAGVRLAALIPPRALERVNAELAKAGMPLDLTQLKPEQLEELVEHLDDLTVEVDGADGQVRAFCE